MGFPCGSAGKESACNVGDLGSFPGLGRSPGEGKGYPLQYSGLENSMDYTMESIVWGHTGVTAQEKYIKYPVCVYTYIYNIYMKKNSAGIIILILPMRKLGVHKCQDLPKAKIPLGTDLQIFFILFLVCLP